MSIRADTAPEPAITGNYRALLDNSTIPIALVSTRGKPSFVAASRGFLDAVGKQRRAVVGRGLDEVVCAAALSRLQASIQRCLISRETVRHRAELAVGDDTHRLRITVHAVNAPGFAGCVMLEVVSSRSAGQAGDRATPEVAGADGDLTFAYVYDLRSDRFRYVDEGLAAGLGLPLRGVMTFADVLALVHPDDLADLPAYERTRAELRDDEFVGTTVRMRDKDGAWRMVNFRARVFRRDRKGRVRAMLGVGRDVSAYAAAALVSASASIRSAEVNERARIGRELHDSTAQYLVAADLGVGQVLHGSAVTDDVRERLRDVQASLSAAQSEMRAFAYVLHPPELKELGLAETMARFCTGFARRSRIAITFAAGALPKELPSDAEHALFRVCQEALMNVYRHAFARTATVALEMRDRDLVLEVRDDGVGVPEDERFEGGGGVGIAGMRARMRSIGGDLRLIARGPGLTVVASVPPPFRTLAGAS